MDRLKKEPAVNRFLSVPGKNGLNHTRFCIEPIWPPYFKIDFNKNKIYLQEEIPSRASVASGNIFFHIFFKKINKKVDKYVLLY